MLLSIIVPFYHVQDYIGACLEAVSCLSGEDCEVLLVDDCGKDGSRETADAFCRSYPMMRVLSRAKNGGLSAARNTGFDEAVGEYVYFLDSDDVPDAQQLLALARQAKAQQLDVAKARFVFFDDETGKETPGPAIAQTTVMEGAALFTAQCRAQLYEPMVWQCLYRRTFLLEHKLRMAEGLLFEDELFQTPALLYAQRAAAFDRVIVRYRQREGSIMASFARSSRWCSSYLSVCRRLHALCADAHAQQARRALCKRIGQIALSTAKNIPAYRLPPMVAAEAMDFVQKNRRELAGYALSSRDISVAVQGVLLLLSPKLFTACYTRAGSRTSVL